MIQQSEILKAVLMIEQTTSSTTKDCSAKRNRRHKTCTMSTREAKVPEEALNMETEQFYKHLDNLKNWEAWVDFCGSHTNFNEHV